MRLAHALPLIALLWSPQAAAAQDDDERPPAMSGLDPELFGNTDARHEPVDLGPVQPPRLLLTIGGGAALRVVQNTAARFSQDRFAPAFVDVFGAFVFGTRSEWRHGIGLGASVNLTGDGGSGDGVGVSAGRQYVLAPAYLGYLRLNDDFFVSVKVSALIAVTPEVVPGGEVAGGLAFLLTSGLGVYGEVGASAFVGSPEVPGANRTVHPMVTAEVGLVIDYELLP